MEKRVQALTKLINYEGDLEDIRKAVSSFSWDSDCEVVTLERRHCIHTLDKYLKGEISESDVEDWANLIECREDIGFESGYSSSLEKCIYELANPTLATPISMDTAKSWKSLLKV